MPHILSVSYDPLLLSTRKMLFESRGYEVTSAEGYTEALRKCRQGEYNLVVLGHSIPHSDKEAIIAETRQHCAAPVLAMLRTNEPDVAGADESVDASRPDLLLDAVKRLITRGNG